MKEQAFFVEDPIYHMTLYFVFGSHKYFMEQVHKVFGLPPTKRENDGELAIINAELPDGSETKAFILWIPNDDIDSISVTLIHELSHFVISAFQFIGIIIDPENQEPFTYYIQMIYSNIMDKLNKKTASRKKQPKA